MMTEIELNEERARQYVQTLLKGNLETFIGASVVEVTPEIIMEILIKQVDLLYASGILVNPRPPDVVVNLNGNRVDVKIYYPDSKEFVINIED